MQGERDVWPCFSPISYATRSTVTLLSPGIVPFYRVEGAVEAALGEDDVGLKLCCKARRQTVSGVVLDGVKKLTRCGVHHSLAVVEKRFALFSQHTQNFGRTQSFLNTGGV